tara:strand:+ start:3174 stop:3926 length:753 start_codon:yes stop_codon:yes gene_type:complete
VTGQFKYTGYSYRDENKDFEVRRPFGPSVYFGKFDSKEIQFLQKLSHEAKDKSEKLGQQLSGNIKGQYDLQNIGTADEQKQFHDIISKHLSNYLRSSLNVFNLDEMPSELDHNVKFNLRGYPWVNFSNAGEFNPMHTHADSIISASLYVDIPAVIKQEKEEAKEFSNQPAPGDIVFFGGLKDNIFESSMFNHTPTTGEIILFPGEMKHAVYPFKSDVERITLSFNIAEFGFIHKETKESKPYRMWCNTYD